jgi:hypothetical protein
MEEAHIAEGILKALKYQGQNVNLYGQTGEMTFDKYEVEILDQALGDYLADLEA